MSNEPKIIGRPDVWSEMYPNRFLKAELFKGKNPTLTIKDVTLELLPDEVKGEVTRGVLTFKQTEKQLALNKVNGLCLRAMFGNKPMEWIGKRVTFTSEQDKFSGKLVDAIRIIGSPDIDSDVEVEVKMPKRKPRMRRLTKTGNTGASATAPSALDSQSPDQNHNPETGEISDSKEPVNG